MDSNVKFRAGNRHPPCVRGRTLESRPLQARVTSRQTSTAGDPRSISKRSVQLFKPEPKPVSRGTQSSNPVPSSGESRFQPPVVKRLGEDETLVALRRDFRTSLAIAADVGTEIGQKPARFAWGVSRPGSYTRSASMPISTTTTSTCTADARSTKSTSCGVSGSTVSMPTAPPPDG